MYNIFELAEIQLRREGNINAKNSGVLLIDRAYAIRKYLDIQERNEKVSKTRRKKSNF